MNLRKILQYLRNLKDVAFDIGHPIGGEVLTYDSVTDKWTSKPIISDGNLADLNDVALQSGHPLNTEVLKYNIDTAKWEAQSDNTVIPDNVTIVGTPENIIGIKLSSIDASFLDTDVGTPGQVLTKGTGDSISWETINIINSLENLSDVYFDTGTPIDEQLLTYNQSSGKWKAKTLSIISLLSGLGDVLFDTGFPETLSLLYFDAIGKWNSNKKLSTDEGLTGNSDDNIPTEQAIKQYVDIGLSGKSASGHVHTEHLRMTIIAPSLAYLKSTVFCICPKTDAELTITNIEVTCDVNPATQVTGDIKYADAFIGLANPVLINDFDTTSGIRSDNSIIQSTIPINKCVYLSFDIAPVGTISQIIFDITYNK